MKMTQDQINDKWRMRQDDRIHQETPFISEAAARRRLAKGRVKGIYKGETLVAIEDKKGHARWIR